MKVTKKLISEIVSQVIGFEAVDMAFYLRGKTDVSEIVVANDMKMTVQEARAMLYKFFEANLASFERKRDKHKGWHISHWDFLDKNIIKIHDQLQQNKISVLRNRLEREIDNEFYMCKSACCRIPFESAVELNYKCRECGELMNPQDNTRTIEVINGKLRELEQVAN